MFITPDGVPVPAVTADEMRELDRVAIDGAGPNLYQMMENAGRSLADLIQGRLESQGGTVTVLAGTGGNGGGGICAARHLANRGVRVEVAVTDPGGLEGVPAQQASLFEATGGRVGALRDVEDREPSLLVDAVIGYGLQGAPGGGAKQMIEFAIETGATVLSLDVPSGLDASTGEAPGVVVQPAATLTLALPKTGLGAAAGEIYLADLGIPEGTYRQAGAEVPAGIFSTGPIVSLSRSGE